VSRFAAEWNELHPAFRRSLGLAYRTLQSGGLAVGAVLTDHDGRIVAEGRNRAYDPLGGDEPLQGTPLAHAEMNALAVARTDWDLRQHTLWSTHEPCAMCRAAAGFVGVDTVRFIADDPSALDEPLGPHPAPTAGPLDGTWAVAARLLFLLSVASKVGLASSILVKNHAADPRTVGLVIELSALISPTASRHCSPSTGG
jgi:tRNA(Arg) A34 adenosine deaminase TadA